MTTNSYNRATLLALVTAATVFVTALWPATGFGQTSSRRDRSRRDTSYRSGSSRTERASRQVSEQRGQETKPAEPNTASTKPVAAVPQSAATDEPKARVRSEASGQWARYELILQRNIFSRQRTPFRPRDRESEARAVVVPNPETYFLLKGVVQENNEFIAFVEDTQDGGVLRLRQGDRVARGVIKTLSLDALEYQFEDKTVSVRLGCDLEGTRGVMAGSTFSAPAASLTSAPAGQQVQTQQAAPAASGNEADIIKRLMEQRKQQLGQ